MITTGQYKVNSQFSIVMGNKQVQFEAGEEITLTACSKEKGLCITDKTEQVVDVPKEFQNTVLANVSMIKRANESADCECGSADCNSSDCYDPDAEPKKEEQNIVAGVDIKAVTRELLDSDKKASEVIIGAVEQVAKSK